MQAPPTSLVANAKDSIGHSMILISQGEDVSNYPTQRNRVSLFSNTLLPAVAVESASSGAVTVRFLHDSTFDLRERHARRKKLEAASHVRHKPPEDEDENEAEERMRKALFEAVENEEEEELQELVEAGARVDDIDWQGRTALMLAAAQGSLGATETLLALDSSCEQQDHTGATALLWAAGSGHDEAALLLLDAGAALDHANYEGDTALMLASEWGHVEVARLLLHKGKPRPPPTPPAPPTRHPPFKPRTRRLCQRRQTPVPQRPPPPPSLAPPPTSPSRAQASPPKPRSPLASTRCRHGHA
jgi:hypothetical protein